MKADDTVPEDLLKYLQKHIPKFKDESQEHQWALAKMVWDGRLKHRKHLQHEDAMSFHYRELEEYFGRSNFKAINDRLGFFKLSDNWSAEHHITKAYWFSDLVQAKRKAYLRIVWRKDTKLIRADGKALKSIPAAVASQDKRGQTTKAWANAKKLNLVKIDLDNLKRLSDWLKAILTAFENGRVHDDLFLELNQDSISRLFDMTRQLIRLGRTKPIGTGFIIQKYEEAQSGRVYGKRLNLQTIPSLIKEAALAGLWEYDFENCHFAIFDQMAAKAGYQCTEIQKYLANRKTIRNSIAEQAGITPEEAKKCLLALLYGAQTTLWDENAIPEAIGAEAASKLYKIPEFMGVKKNIKEGRNVILKNWPKTANGLVNGFGKAIASNAKPVEQIAHLTQGVEAKALQTALDMHPNEIVLLQHDGFATTSRIDIKAITDAVWETTGYHLNLEEKLIQINPDAYFLKTQNKADSKVKKLVKPMPMRLSNGFSNGFAS